MIKNNPHKQEQNQKILPQKTVGYAVLWAALLLASPVLTDRAFAGLVQANNSFSPTSISQGDTTTLSISIFNSSNQILTNVGLPDNMPTQLKILPAGVTSNTCGGTVTAVPGTSNITLSGGTVPAISGSTAGRCTINIAVTATAPGNHINTINANTLTNDQGQTNDTSSSSTLQTLALTTATVQNAWSPTTISGGQISNYTITLNNPNVGKNLTGAQISQTFPAALTIQTGSVATTCAGGTVNVTGQVITLSGGTIPAAPNSSTPGTCTVTIPVTSFTAGAYPLSIPANALTTDSGVTNDAATASTTLNVQSGVTVAKAFGGTLRENSTVPINVTITNNNGVTLTGVGITDNLPNPGLTYSSLSSNTCGGTVTPSGNNVILSGGSIPANSSCTFTFNALTDRTQGTSITNTIPANSLTNNLSQTNGSAVTASTTVQRALNVTKSFAPASITPGGSSTLTINIQNNSTNTGTVSLTDTLPTVGSSVGPPALPAGNILIGTGSPTSNANCGTPTITATSGTGTITVNNATIPAGATCTVTVPITSNTRANAYTNTIASGNVTSPEGLTTATATAPITVTNPLTFAKSFVTTPVNPGFSSQMKVSITNSNTAGGLSATNLQVTDTLPANLVIATPTNVTSANCGTPNFGSVTAGGNSFNVTGVTVAPATTCDLFVDVKSDIANTYNNTIATNGIFSTEGWSNSSAVIGTLNVNRPFAVGSTFQNPPQTNSDTTNVTIDAGQVAKIRFDVTNISATSKSGVGFSDALPSNVTVASVVNPVFGLGCGGSPATTTAANSGTVNFSGVTIAAGATCTLTVDVTSLVPSPSGYSNSINTNSVTHASGPNTNLTAASSTNRLVVTSPFAGTGRAGADPNASGTGTLIPAPSKTFSVTPILQNTQTSVLTINIPNGAAISATNVGLTDTLPAGLVVADVPTASATNCGTPTFSPVANATSFSLSGATIAAGATCTLQVNVKGTTTGAKTNTIAANAITSTQNFPSSNFSAPITVVGNTIIVGKSFPTANLVPGQTRTLILTIQNNDLSSSATGVTITDNLGAANLKIRNGGTFTPTFANCGLLAANPIISGGATSITFTGGTIAPNTTCTITLTNGITSDIPSATPYTNTIAADGADFNSSLGKDTAPRSATMTVNPAFTVNKSFNNAGAVNQTIAAGNTATIRINIFKQNAGTSPATGVSITDALPANLVLASSTATFSNSCGTGPAPTFTGTVGSGTFTASNIRIVNNTTCTIDATVTSAVPGTYTNTIPIANFSSANVGGIVANVTSQNTLTVTSPLISTKSFLTNPVTVGSPTTLRINLQNNNANLDATGVNVTDSLPTTPGNLIIADIPNISSGNCGSPTITAPVGGQTVTVTGATIIKNTTCTVNVDVKSNTLGAYTNTIPATNVTSTQGWNAQGAANANLTVSSGLTVSKNFQPAIVHPGTPVRLTVTLTNSSPFPLTNAAVIDTLTSSTVVANPANASTTCVGGTVAATPGGTTINLSGATIPSQVSGIPGTCTFRADVIKSNTGTFNNSIPINAVTTAEGIQNTNAATATLTTQNLFVEIVKGILPVNIEGGDPSIMTVTLTNNNNVQLDNVGFTDNMPAGMLIFSPIQTTTTCTNGIITAIPNDNKFTFSGATMPANSSCNLTVKITASQAGTITNTIDIGAVSSDQGAKNTLATSASLTALPAVIVTKDFTPPTIKPGAVGTLKVTLINTNNAALTGVNFTDNLPPGPPAMVIAPSPNGSTTCGGGIVSATPGSGTLSFSGGTIPGNGQCLVTVDITSSGIGQLTNTIAANAVTTNEGATNKNPGTRVFNILNPPVISKVFSPVSILPGAVSTLTVTVSNSNPTPYNLTNASLTDNLPSGVTIATPANASTTCGGTLNATSGNNQFSIAGSTIPANSNCTVTLDVTSTTLGTVTNTIPANSITTAEQTTNENPATAPLTIANPSNPELLLVKRITKINGQTTADNTSGGTINLTNVVDDPGDPNDNNSAWPAGFLQGAFNNVAIKPGDEIEYTIYFISSGTTALSNVSVCDLVPPNTTFNRDTFGTDKGIIFQLGNTSTIQTNVIDSDKSRFIYQGVSAPGLCRVPPDVNNPLSAAQNRKGAVLVDIVQGAARLPESAPGSPNYGFIRFRVKVD